MYNPNIKYRMVRINGRVAIFKRDFMHLNWSVIGIYPSFVLACNAIEDGHDD